MTHHIRPIPESAQYRDGHAAYHAGRTIHACAYAYGTYARKQWVLGYFAAEREMKAAVERHVTSGENKS